MGKLNNTDYPIIAYETPDDWSNWLEENNNKVNGIWMRIYKKGSGIRSIVYDEALDIALCYGWIDGQLKSIDEKSYKQKFTPRRSKSNWSKRNIEKVAKLLENGLMKPSGMKAVEEAKADGRWERAYDSPGKMTIPQDFMDELQKNSDAYSFFETLNKTNLYTIGYRLQTAKDEESRQQRMKMIIEMLSRKEKFHD